MADVLISGRRSLYLVSKALEKAAPYFAPKILLNSSINEQKKLGTALCRNQNCQSWQSHHERIGYQVLTMNIYKYHPIYTQDGIRLGEAHCLYHRTKDIRPEWQLYASYVHVVSLEMGDDFFVPTAFIAGPDPETGKMVLTVPMHEVERQTWTRLPDFIWRREAKEEMLPEREEVVA